MPYCAAEVILWAVFATFTIGVSSNLTPTLTIQDSSSSEVECDMDTVFMCRVANPPSISLIWVIHGGEVASCSSTLCGSSNSNYNATLNDDGTLFYLTVDTVLLNDNEAILCQPDNLNSNEITPVRRDKPTKSKYDINEVNATITVTSDCMEQGYQLVYQLQVRKVNGSEYEDYSVENTTQRNTCPSDESLNCGDGDKFKGFLSMTIPIVPNDENGEMYTLKLSIIYDNDEDPIIFDGTYFSTYRLADYYVDTTTKHASADTQPTSATLLPNTTLSNSTQDKTNETNTDITATDKPNIVMQTPFIFLTVGLAILAVLILSCAIHIVYICVNKHTRRKTTAYEPKSTENIDTELHSTNM